VVAGRECGACNVCCVVPKIDEPALRKLPGCRCPNALADGSCAIYDERPQTCRDFYCGWRQMDWIDERLRPDQSGIFIRLTGDKALVTGEHPFAMMVTVLSPDRLNAPGLVETVLTAVNAGITSYLIVPGPPGYTSCRMPLNRALQEAAANNDKQFLLASLRELHARTQANMGKTRPVILCAPVPSERPMASRPETD
jgi:hypothetical protein